MKTAAIILLGCMVGVGVAGCDTEATEARPPDAAAELDAIGREVASAADPATEAPALIGKHAPAVSFRDPAFKHFESEQGDRLDSEIGAYLRRIGVDVRTADSISAESRPSWDTPLPLDDIWQQLASPGSDSVFDGLPDGFHLRRANPDAPWRGRLLTPAQLYDASDGMRMLWSTVGRGELSEFSAEASREQGEKVMLRVLTTLLLHAAQTLGSEYQQEIEPIN